MLFTTPRNINANLSTRFSVLIEQRQIDCDLGPWDTVIFFLSIFKRRENDSARPIKPYQNLIETGASL